MRSKKRKNPRNYGSAAHRRKRPVRHPVGENHEKADGYLLWAQRSSKKKGQPLILSYEIKRRKKTGVPKLKIGLQGAGNAENWISLPWAASAQT